MAAQWPVQTYAVGVVDRRDPGFDERRVDLQRIGADDGMLFPWASMTKLCSALGILVATEEKILELDEPAGPTGSTVSHLLAHASGLAPDDGRVLAAPAQRRIYSNEGFRVLGRLLKERSGIPFASYLGEAVLEPLGMHGTTMRTQHEDPAAGLQGPMGDLLALGRELLNPTLVHPATFDMAIEVAFPGLNGVLPGFGRQEPCDWGLGFEIRDNKRPHWTGARNSPQTFGHFGQSGGFLWVDPIGKMACAALTDRPFGSWAKQEWPVLADAVLGGLDNAES